LISKKQGQRQQQNIESFCIQHKLGQWGSEINSEMRFVFGNHLIIAHAQGKDQIVARELVF